MTDLDDLIARLRDVDVDSDHDCYMSAPLFSEAAAALEALRDENERLREALGKAANRLDWAAGIIATDTGRDRASAWADEARAALKRQ